jgi:hypothetical protein
MDEQTEELLRRFPRQRAATTKASRAIRYIIDVIYYGDEAKVILGSIENERSTVVRAESVTLLNGWVGEDRGTVQWMNGNKQHDDYRTTQELADLEPTREARRKRISAVSAAIVAFVAAHPEGVDEGAIREHLAEELSLDPADRDLYGRAMFATIGRVKRKDRYGVYTLEQPTHSR